MASYIDYLGYWKYSLDNFAQQRTSWLSRKKWSDYISDHPLRLWGKPPEALAVEVKRYWEKPTWARRLLAIVTPIQKKEKLWLYYSNQQAFNGYLQRLPKDQQEKVQQAYHRGHSIMQSPIQKPPVTKANTFTASARQFWSSIMPKADLLSKEKSEQLRQQAFLKLIQWTNKVYKHDQKRLRTLYNQPGATQDKCITEQRLSQSRQKAFDKAIAYCQKTYLTPCTAEDKEAFLKDAKEFFIKAEKAMNIKMVEIALSPTIQQGDLLRERYLKNDTLAIIPIKSTHRMPLNNANAAVMAVLSDEHAFKEQLAQIKVKLNPGLSAQEAIQLFDNYYRLTEAYLTQLSRYGQQSIEQAKYYLYADKLPEDMLPVKETHQAMVQRIDQCYRLVTLSLHPDKVEEYDAKVKEHVNVLFRQLGLLKEEQLAALEIASINPKDELERWQKAQAECERLRKENAEQKEERVNLTEKLKKMERQAEEIERQGEQKEREIEEAKREIKEAKRETKEARCQIDQINQEAKELKEKMEKMEKLITGLMDQSTHPNANNQERTEPQVKMRFFS